MKFWTNENGIPTCEPDCADEWLFDILVVGCDYDGENSVEGLKKCIDYLVEIPKKQGSVFGTINYLEYMGRQIMIIHYLH